MKRLELLRGEDTSHDQILETDVMRFVAIIGIVFWILFALIKSLPFQTVETESRLSRPNPENADMKVSSKPKIHPNDELDKVPESTHKMEEPEAKKMTSATSQDTDVEVPTKERISEEEGLHIQFRTLDDLLALIKTHKVKLFVRAKAPGFDLFFEGYQQGSEVRFRNVNNFPPGLWEIKSGKDREHFLNVMAEAYPAIRSFHKRQVLVAFTDEKMERHIELTLSRLEHEEQNGILSITSAGDVIFRQFE